MIDMFVLACMWISGFCLGCVYGKVRERRRAWRDVMVRLVAARESER